MQIGKRITFLAALALSLSIHGYAQRPSNFAGTYWARSFAFGVNPNVAPLTVAFGGGTTASGAGTLALNVGYAITPDNITFTPLATNAPILVGVGASAETVTPTAVSCRTPAIPGTCTITATFSYAHGPGDLIASGSVGLDEAINYAQANGGGFVEVDNSWQGSGGTAAMITAAPVFAAVALDDNRTGNGVFWTVQPATLTLLAAPATLTSSTAVFSAAPAGTWTAAAQYLCITYIDALGGEGPCSATYNVTPAATTSLTITAPAASTGAVGWRAYGGASYAGAYLLPVTATACTLTTLETTIPACSLSSNGLWTAIFVTTTQLKPAPATPLENVNNIVPQGHTTFAYQPSAGNPVPFQAHFGPFPALGTITAGNFAVLGTAQLPTGYLNQIGRAVRISGKMTATVTTGDTFTVIMKLGWQGGDTAGAGVTVCTMAETTAYTATAVTIPFYCILTTNAVGTTAVGSVTANGMAAAQITAGTTPATVLTDNSTAAVGSLGLFAQNTLYVSLGSIAQAASAAQLMDLHIETLL